MTTTIKHKFEMLAAQKQIDDSGEYFASCEGNGTIRAIPKNTSLRSEFFVRITPRGGILFWLARNGEECAVRGKDARNALSIACWNG